MTTDLLQSGLPPANDRMLTTCFLAALFHAIVILGVTFSSPGGGSQSAETPELQVIIVNDQAPRVAKNPDAKYLSERSQLGSGNTLKRERTLIPKSSLMPIERKGLANGDGLAAHESAASMGEQELLATNAPAPTILYFAAPLAAREPAELPLLLQKRPDLGMAPNDDGVELRMRGEAKQQLWIAADTRESEVAVYLDAWRRRVERVGTMNFPEVARRRKLSGTPVLEVIIGADGKLLQTLVRRGSGHVEIYEAAMRILKLAAPFNPFPAALAAKHDEIRIAYEWQFLGADSQAGGVYYAEPNH